jgi:hypothetical protein
VAGADDFEKAVQAQIREILTTTKYKPRFYMEMVARHGAVQTAIQLARESAPSEGFTRLWEMKRLDLTVEALMCKPQFASDFDAQDIDAARRKLAKYGHVVP